MEYSYIPQLILSAIFMFLLISQASTQSPQPLVEDICNEIASLSTSVKFEDCVGALELDPRTSTANITTLAQISIELGVSNSTDTQTFIKNMINDIATPPTLQKPLKICLSSYEEVVMSFKSALAELDEDILSANYDVKLAGDYAKDCEDELSRDNAQIPSVTTRNNYARLYSDIGFVVTDRLELQTMHASS